MKISVIVPCYNEENTIREIIDRVKKVNLEKEIIVIDDYSNDGTKDILKELKDDNIKIICHEKNKGKGAAIKTGLKYVSGDIVIIQDADLEYDPQDYYKLVQPIIEGKAEVVYGSRNLNKKHRKISGISYLLGGLFVTWLTNIFYRTNITDEPTGYKVFKTEIIKKLDLQCEHFEFCPEVTAKIAKKGYRIYEVPISYNPRSSSEGKKINWKDGLAAVWTLIKYRFLE